MGSKFYVRKSIAKTFLFTNRQKSSSEIETRNIGPGGQDFEDDSKYPLSITYCQLRHSIVGATFQFIVYCVLRIPKCHLYANKST